MIERKKRNSNDFDSLYDLVAAVIEDGQSRIVLDDDLQRVEEEVITKKALAHELGISLTAVYRKLDRNDSLVFRLDELPSIVALYSDIDLRILDFLADKARCVVCRLPDTGDHSTAADMEMSELLRQFGELASRFVEARRLDSPGGRGFSRREKADLLTLACEVQKRAAGLVAAINQEEETP